MPVIASSFRAVGFSDPIKVQACNNLNPAIVYDEQTFTDHEEANNFYLNVPSYDFYLIRFLQIPPGNPAGILLDKFVKDLTENCTSEEPDIEIEVDGGRELFDPISGQSTVLIPSLSGRIFRLYQESFGYLIRGIEFDILPSGGFQLLGGQLFQTGVGYFIQFFPPNTTADPDLIMHVGFGGPYDPAPDSNSINIPELKGVPFRLVQRGYGPLKSQITPEFVVDEFGTITLLGGRTFEYNDFYFIQKYPTICITMGGGNSGGAIWSEGEFEIKTDSIYNETHKNKLLVFRSDGLSVTYELPDLAAFPPGDIIAFEANGGNQIYGTIKTKPNQYIDYKVPNQVNTSKVYLAKGEQVWLTKGLNDKWRIVHANWGYDLLGTDVISKAMVKNTIRKYGEVFNKVVYARIWDWVLENSSIYPIVSDIAWNIYDFTSGERFNTGYFADINVNEFRAPDDRNYSYRSTSGNKLPGSKELDRVGPVNGHFSVSKGNSFTGNPGGGYDYKIFGHGQVSANSVSMPISVSTGSDETKVKAIIFIPQIKI